jgi:hypothetical protein
VSVWYLRGVRGPIDGSVLIVPYVLIPRSSGGSLHSAPQGSGAVGMSSWQRTDTCHGSVQTKRKTAGTALGNLHGIQLWVLFDMIRIIHFCLEVSMKPLLFSVIIRGGTSPQVFLNKKLVYTDGITHNCTGTQDVCTVLTTLHRSNMVSDPYWHAWKGSRIRPMPPRIEPK